MENKIDKLLLNEEELTVIADKLHNKVSKYFQECLKKEMDKIKPALITQEQVRLIVTFVLGMTTADLINIFAKMAGDGGVALSMLSCVSKLADKAVFDFYEANKAEIH